jgi:two-component system chemotaxis response regulator CheY
VSVKSILLVEDDLAFARFMIGSFRDVDPGIELFHVNGGHAAISVMNAGFRPGLILCEERMPGMSGSELLLTVRSDPDMEAVPFITFTSSFADENPAAAGKMPMDMKVPRPASYREALAFIKRVRFATAHEVHAPGEGQAAEI